jgi:hypothetical protein
MTGADRTPLVPQKPQGYAPAEALAVSRWQERDPILQAERCGATARTDEGTTHVVLPFLNTSYAVGHPEGTVRLAGGEAIPDIAERILVLHYLSADPPVGSSGKQITFADLPDGRFYNAAFLRRTRDQLLRAFGANPARLLTAGAAVGASATEVGDASLALRPFPGFGMTVVMWKGDDEFAAEASVLFDEDVRYYLCAEDIAVLSGIVVRRLVGGAVRPKDDLCL